MSQSKIFYSINPFTSEIIQGYPAISVAQLDEKIASSEKAFQHLKNMSAQKRGERIAIFANQLAEKKDALAQIITLEMGKVYKESLAEIEKCILCCQYYSAHTEGISEPEFFKTDAQESFVVHQPIGVVFGIMPWNFPFWQAIRFAIPALAAGNVVLLKHAPNVFGCAEALEEIINHCGFPDNIFQSLFIDTDLVEKVIASDSVQGIAFTGSEIAGGKVAALAGKHIKKSVLELGGSDPFIVLKDADIDKAVTIAMLARLQNAGQSCIAAKRFVVVQEVYNVFVEKLLQKIKNIKQGDPFDSKVNIGPLARLDLAEKLKSQVDISVLKGAEILLEGTYNKCNVSPTVLTNVQPGMPAFDEELFGPVFSVIKVKNADEAIAMANNHRYGLGASIWTSDLIKGKEIALQIESGNVYINTLVKSDPRLPFGGTKKSGYGRELSVVGAREFTNAKTIYINN